jgi:glycosyltransferase involved in cell wall biosynthesis
MITTHRKHLEQRCRQRGYPLAEVMLCVVKQDGDQWTVDTEHPAYPRRTSRSGATTAKPKTKKLVAVSNATIAARREACSECRKLRKTKHGQAYCRTHYDGCQRRAVGQYTNALLKQEPWCEPWLAMPLKPVMDGRGCLVCSSQIGVTGVGKQASASDENGDDQDKLDNAQTQVSHDSTPRVVTTESHATTPAKSTLFIAGHPHRLGGAGPHLWAVIRALRSVGVDVAILKKPDPKNFWYKRLMDLGVRYIPCKKPWLAPGIDGGIVGAWCSKTFCRHAHEFKARGCKVIWSGCMTFPLADERAHYAKHGFFDRHVVNSHFQHTLLRDALDKIAIPVPADKSHLPTGVKSGHSGHFITRAVHIPTPFWPDEFPFKPRPVEGEFVIGRLSRAADDKYQKDLWKCYGTIRDAAPLPVRARVMAWSDKVEKWCGPPPEWAECLKANQESTIDFLHSLHCMVHKNGGAKENRPRVCMEAMATGCPVVAEACAGWPELIEHERTGFLCGSRNEFVEAVGRLASDEKLRQRIIHDARESLSTIANNAEIANAWKNMLEELQCQ